MDSAPQPPPGDDPPVTRSVADAVYRDRQRPLGAPPDGAREADAALARYLDLRPGLRAADRESGP